MALWWRYLVMVAGGVAVAAPVQFRFDHGSRSNLQLTPSIALAKAGGGGNGNAGGNGNSGNGNGGGKGENSNGGGPGNAGGGHGAGNSGNGNSGKGGPGGSSGTVGVGGGASNGAGSASGGGSGRAGGSSGNRTDAAPGRSGEVSGRSVNASNPAGKKATDLDKERKSRKSYTARKMNPGAAPSAKPSPNWSAAAGKKNKGTHEIRSGQAAKGGITRDNGKIASGTVAIRNDRLELIGSPSKPRQAPNSIVVSGLSEQELAKLAASGLQVTSQTRGLIAPRVVRLNIPPGMSIVEAERAVQRINFRASADADSYYYTDGGESGCAAPGCDASTLVGWKPIAADACEAPPLIGLIDTGIDLEHEALKGQSIELLDISRVPGNRSSLDHGTAIAALLVGRPGSITPGLVPRASLIAVDAFARGDGTADRSDVVSLVSALEALADRGVKVVNLSLSGPPNAVLEAAIEAARARGMVLVAAVGNNGAGADPSYPAAYPGVIGVTAVDRQLDIYRRATRGPYVAFAAPGVEVRMAQSKGGSAVRSGTSYAVPFVSAAMAMMLANNAGLDVEGLEKHLQDTTRDLGVPGKDTTFGYGLVQMANLCSAPKARPIPVVGNVSSVEPLRNEGHQAP